MRDLHQALKHDQVGKERFPQRVEISE